MTVGQESLVIHEVKEKHKLRALGFSHSLRKEGLWGTAPAAWRAGPRSSAGAGLRASLRSPASMEARTQAPGRAWAGTRELSPQETAQQDQAGWAVVLGVGSALRPWWRQPGQGELPPSPSLLSAFPPSEGS